MSSAGICSIVLLVSACATGDDGEASLRRCEPVGKDAPDRAMRLAIDEMGLCGSSAVDLGEAYRVEGDVLVLKSTLADKQARHTSLVSTTNIRTVSVRVAASIPNDGGVDDWRAAVEAAALVWNAVPYSLVRFEYTTGTSADITFRSDVDHPDGPLESNQAAAATWPSGGNPGPSIFVNLDLYYMNQSDYPLSEGQKLFIAVHELGHNIGLRHTDWALEDSDEYGDAIDIPGTSAYDPASVMNAETAGHEWNRLSAGDVLAIKTIYPEVVTLVVEYTGCTNGIPRMTATWGGTLVTAPLRWQLDRNVNNSWSTVYSGLAQTRTFNVPTGQWLKLRVKGESAEGWSMTRAVSKAAPSCGTPPQ